MKHRMQLAALAALLVLGACAPVPEHRAGFFVFGTLVEVIVRDVSAEQAQEAFAEVQRTLQSMHRDWHAWEPGPLTEINHQFAAGRAAAAPEDIIELLQLSQDMETRTGGRFNAAAGGLVSLWGFHTSEFPVTAPAPPESAIETWLASSPSTHDIKVQGRFLQSANPSTQLDFGGIAKGYAVDRIITLLAERDITQVMVNAGGDLRAVGASPAAPWRVGVRAPGKGVVAGIEIDDAAAVFTSGVDQRFRERDGQRYPHILDPRSGRPVQGLASVTVVAAQGWLADAAATALMVAGPGEWAELAAGLGLDQVLVIDDAGGYHATPAMAGRLQWADGLRGDIELNVVEPTGPNSP
ncbi:MAG: FAD:protein FMN transferase [Xanthomonadales bacterium]|nr:FAD:protein FMN transferase [Xanthomonadales bacterium]